MDWNATFKNVGIHGVLVLLVFIVGPALAFPSFHYRKPISLENVNPHRGVESSASTAEVLRNIKKILSVTRPVGGGGGKRKLVKQEEAGTEGAANALAYLTDSFGGQLAGQILSVILSSVTGDVRGILGNSLNLFQTDESRDRVQLFLDDISQNFLKFTGLQALVTTKSPLQQSTAYPGQPVLVGTAGSGQTQLQQAQAFPIASLGPASSSSYLPASASYGGGSTFAGTGSYGASSSFGGSSSLAGGVGGSSSSSSLSSSATLLQQQQQQQKPQQSATAQQPIIYVLPQLANGGGTTSSGSGSKVTATKTTTISTNSGDDDSEEERKLWSYD